MTPYRWIRRLGEGSFGEVWAAERAGARIAVKVLVRAPAGSPAEEAIRREITLGARLVDVPGVVAVRSAEPHDGLLHLEMDLVDGPDLERVLERAAPLPSSIAVPWMVGVLRTLYAAGEALGDPIGFAHRDVKPANLLVADDGTLRITDFGMARAGASVDITTTRTGVVKGTPRTMAPEVLRSEVPDNRADQFSVGAVLVELLTGRPLYEGSSLREVLDRVARADVDAALRALEGSPQRPVLERMLAFDRSDRYPSCAEAADALAATPTKGPSVHEVLPALIRLSAEEVSSPLEDPPTSPDLGRVLDTWEVTRDLIATPRPAPAPGPSPVSWVVWIVLGAAGALLLTGAVCVVLSLAL